jgi:plasmid stability protein
MTTTLDLPADLVEDIHLRAEKEGRGLDETVAELLRAGLAASSARSATAIQAIERLRDLRRGIRLNGENLRDLIDQGRRN